jgi:toxin ParE1/3/4
MSKLKLIISEQASNDLMDVWLYIANDSPQTADRFIDFIYEECCSLCLDPGLGRARDELFPGMRSFPVKRYIIFYRISSDSVEIVRVLSGYRDLNTLF